MIRGLTQTTGRGQLRTMGGKCFTCRGCKRKGTVSPARTSRTVRTASSRRR